MKALTHHVLIGGRSILVDNFATIELINPRLKTTRTIIVEQPLKIQGLLCEKTSSIVEKYRDNSSIIPGSIQLQSRASPSSPRPVHEIQPQSTVSPGRPGPALQTIVE